MKIFVTGGAGYIGSTICSALLDVGHTPVILDSLITGRVEFTKGRVFYQGDIADSTLIKRLSSVSLQTIPIYLQRFTVRH
jgi:UDP-glucose 4-epimerase